MQMLYRVLYPNGEEESATEKKELALTGQESGVKCYNCNKIGHKAYACPDKKRRKGEKV